MWLARSSSKPAIDAAKAARSDEALRRLHARLDRVEREQDHVDSDAGHAAAGEGKQPAVARHGKCKCISLSST